VCACRNHTPTPPRATPSMPRTDSERGKEKRKKMVAALGILIGARCLNPAVPAPRSSSSHPFCYDQSSPPRSTSRHSSAPAPAAMSSTPPPHPPDLLVVHVPLPLPCFLCLVSLDMDILCSVVLSWQTALAALLHCTYYITS